jgi:hypothetical protein
MMVSRRSKAMVSTVPATMALVGLLLKAVVLVKRKELVD